MTEFAPQGYRIEAVDVDRARELAEMVERGASDRFVTDRVENALLKSMVQEFSDQGRLTPHIAEMFALKRAQRSSVPIGYALRLVEFAIDKQMREMYPADVYPINHSGDKHRIDFTTKEGWMSQDIFGRLDYNDLHEDIYGDLRSNISMGYEIFKLLSYAHRDRWSRPPVVVDIGGSMGLGLKKWLLHDKYPFKPIEVLSAPRPGQPISPELPPDRTYQSVINGLVDTEPIIGPAISSDAVPIMSGSAEAIKLVFSHTFPFSESARNPEAVEEFFNLTWEQPADMVTVQRFGVDATDPESMDRLRTYLPGDQADIFLMSAVLFEMPPEDSLKVMENIRSLSSPNALCFVSDFARVDKNSINGLNIIRRDWWHRLGSFATFQLDPFASESPPVEICRYLTRRCEQMWLTPDGQKVLGQTD